MAPTPAQKPSSEAVEPLRAETASLPDPRYNSLPSSGGRDRSALQREQQSAKTTGAEAPSTSAEYSYASAKEGILDHFIKNDLDTIKSHAARDRRVGASGMSDAERAYAETAIGELEARRGTLLSSRSVDYLQRTMTESDTKDWLKNDCWKPAEESYWVMVIAERLRENPQNSPEVVSEWIEERLAKGGVTQVLIDFDAIEPGFFGSRKGEERPKEEKPTAERPKEERPKEERPEEDVRSEVPERSDLGSVESGFFWTTTEPKVDLPYERVPTGVTQESRDLLNELYSSRVNALKQEHNLEVLAYVRPDMESATPTAMPPGLATKDGEFYIIRNEANNRDPEIRDKYFGYRAFKIEDPGIITPLSGGGYRVRGDVTNLSEGGSPLQVDLEFPPPGQKGEAHWEDVSGSDVVGIHLEP